LLIFVQVFNKYMGSIFLFLFCGVTVYNLNLSSLMWNLEVTLVNRQLIQAFMLKNC